MADLIATPALAGLSLPLALGTCRLSAIAPGPIAAIAPYPGQTVSVAARLGGFPEPGQVVQTPAGWLAWAGRETAFLLGAAPDLATLAAVTDQSDGWAGLRLEGADAQQVLARLVPVDLAPLAPPAALRSLLNHLPLLLIHPAPETWDIYSFRSMAGTMLHDLEAAMRSVAARRERG